MKKLLLVVLCILILLTSVPCVFAEDTVNELPEIKIVVNGQKVVLTDVTLGMGGRIFLPLSDLLTNLGVPDDGEHIIWNNDEKSVTVLKDATKIYLKVGDRTAYINDSPVPMDVAPFTYKNGRTYIPIGFVSQALGKKTVWDGATRTVYIRDGDEFEKTKDLIEKSMAAMLSVKKVRLQTSLKMDMLKQDSSLNADMNMNTAADRENGRMYITLDLPIFGQNFKFDYFYINNAEFVKSSLTGQWEQKALTAEQFKAVLKENTNMLSLCPMDVLCAGLIMEEAGFSGEIKLKGNVYPGEFSRLLRGNETLDEFIPEDYQMEYYINNETFLPNRLTMDLKGKISSDTGDSLLSSRILCNYSDFDGDFAVEPPEGLDIQ